ncbi:MAG TPA: Fis family transcriptional regulator [Myxococcaceae bacterium]|nr:Fis family transcriptional regulator [Myxococcaceae bacterium]
MVEYGGYAEEDLISNRSALLLYGGNEEDRRAWAYEAGAHFASEGSVVEARTAAELVRGLELARGTVFVPDVLGLGLDAQSMVLRCLQEREERPKIVLGLSRLPDEAIQQGLLREDLSYRLRLARVNLDAEGLREAIQARREKLEQKLAAAKELVQPKAVKKKPSKPARRASRDKRPARKPAKKKSARSKPRARKSSPRRSLPRRAKKQKAKGRR